VDGSHQVVLTTCFCAANVWGTRGCSNSTREDCRRCATECERGRERGGEGKVEGGREGRRQREREGGHLTIQLAQKTTNHPVPPSRSECLGHAWVLKFHQGGLSTSPKKNFKTQLEGSHDPYNSCSLDCSRMFWNVLNFPGSCTLACSLFKQELKHVLTGRAPSPHQQSPNPGWGRVQHCAEVDRDDPEVFLRILVHLLMNDSG